MFGFGYDIFIKSYRYLTKVSFSLIYLNYFILITSDPSVV